jgi:hypothetical protein
MRLSVSVLASAALGLSLAACELPHPDKAAETRSKTFIDEVATGADLSKDPTVDPQLSQPDQAPKLALIHAMFPRPKPTKVTSSGWSITSRGGEGSRAELAYSYVYPEGTVVTRTVLRKPPGKTDWIVTGFQARRDAGPVVLGEAPASDSGSTSSDHMDD